MNMNSNSIAVQFAVESANLPSEQHLIKWAQHALSHANANGGEITLRLTDADEIQALNQQYRSKNKPTNVLSFPFEMPVGIPLQLEEQILGDIILCATVIEKEANEQHKEIFHHWAHMVVHGVLHLLGYDHIENAEAAVMEQLEIEVLATLGIPNPYLITDEHSLENDNA